MILAIIDESVASGCSQEAACARLGLSERTVQRWRQRPGDDRRQGPQHRPANALTEAEKAHVLEVVNSPEFRDLSPKQIVPCLADRGEYEASESTMYRLLREAGQLAHRSRAKPPSGRVVEEHRATGPLQVWSWDITYLKGPIAGCFFYLYLFIDVWSRKIVGCAVHEEQSPDLAAELMLSICMALGVDPNGIVLHSDNGDPMKGSTMLATLQRLGIVPSFSRPGVSDDNPFSEALFRTLKYRPSYPSKPFETIEAARSWVADFMAWYNGHHRHSAIRFVTPDQRHSRREGAVLEQRRRVYAQARRRHPERWTGATRNWQPVGDVYLNPQKPTLSRDSSHSFPLDALRDHHVGALGPAGRHRPAPARGPTAGSEREAYALMSGLTLAQPGLHSDSTGFRKRVTLTI